MFAEDLTVFFSATEFATVATWGALSANVLLNAPTEDLLGGRTQGIAYEALLAASAFPGIARGDEVTIAAVAFVVREVPAVGDGALKRLLLATVP